MSHLYMNMYIIVISKEINRAYWVFYIERVTNLGEGKPWNLKS